MVYFLVVYIDNVDFIVFYYILNFTFNLIDESIKLILFMVYVSVYIFEIFIIWINCFIKVYYLFLCLFSLYV